MNIFQPKFLIVALSALSLSLFICPEAMAQLVRGADIIFVKSSDGKKLLARITKVSKDDLDVVSTDGKTHKTFKLSELTKMEFVGRRKVKGYFYTVDFYRFHKTTGAAGTWGISNNATFQIVYGDNLKWNTGTGGAKVISLASQKFMPPSTKPKVSSKKKLQQPEKKVEIPRRFRRGVTNKANLDTRYKGTDKETKRKRGVYWSRSTSLPKDVGTSIADAGAICYNSVVEGNMHSKDYDTFKFFFPGGNFVCYSLGNLDLVADILNSKGKSIARAFDHDGTKNFRFEKSLEPGNYFVQVRVMRHANTGPYYLILGNGRKQFKESRTKGDTF